MRDEPEVIKSLLLVSLAWSLAAVLAAPGAVLAVVGGLLRLVRACSRATVRYEFTVYIGVVLIAVASSIRFVTEGIL